MDKRPRRPYGTGGLSQRPSDGRWIGTVVLPDGKRKTVSDRSYRKASEKLEQLKADIRVGKVATGPDQTVADYLATWLRDVVQPNRRPNTYMSYESTVRLHIVPTIGAVKLRDLKPQHVQAMLAEMARAGLNPGSQRTTKTILSVALNRAVDWELVTRNVASRAVLPKGARTARKPLPPELLPRFLAVIGSHRLFAYWIVALAGGLRAGELDGLRWQNVDLETARVEVVEQLQWVHGEPGWCDCKRAASERTVWLPPYAVETLRAHQERQALERLWAGSGWTESGLVFPTDRGGPIPRNHGLHQLTRLLKKAGLPHVKVHELRNSYAHYLIRTGTDPRTAADLLGHVSTEMTLDIYAQSSEQQKREAAARLDALFRKEIS